MLIIPCLILSCKKEKPTGTPSKSNYNSFTLKKDGVSYSANSITISAYDNVISFEALATASQMDYNSYAGFIRKDITPGTYSILEGVSDDFSLYHFRDSNSEYGPNNGTLTVISNDTVSKTIHCTFEISLYNDQLDEYPLITNGNLTFHYN